MRDIQAYPITYEEIGTCLEKMARETVAEGMAPGDMRAFLLMEGARLIRTSGSGPIPQEFPAHDGV